MGFKKWVVSDFDKELAKELAYECDVDPIVSLIASARGYTDPMELEQFLSDEPVFSNPQVMTDIVLASEIINAAVEDKRKIAIFGDYDCDGVTAIAVMYNYLKSRNADCIYYIPDRFKEGYGMKGASAGKGVIEGGAEWYEQADHFMNLAKDKTLADIKAIAVDEGGYPTSDEMKAGCTMKVKAYIAAINNALGR